MTIMLEAVMFLQIDGEILSHNKAERKLSRLLEFLYRGYASFLVLPLIRNVYTITNKPAYALEAPDLRVIV